MSELFHIYKDEDLLKCGFVKWIIKKILPANGVVCIYGPSGTGKSFFIIYMLATIFHGLEWFGYKTKNTYIKNDEKHKRPLTYVVLEGAHGVPQRMMAYRNHFKKTTGIHYMSAPMDLREKEDCDKLIRTLKNAGLVHGVLCIDTLAQSAPGIDENTGKEMGPLIKNFQQIQRELGGVVIFIHHTGKDESRGMRGWSGTYAAIDTAIELKHDKEANIRSWFLEKSKDNADGLSDFFNLKSVYLGDDEDGDPVFSCVVKSMDKEAYRDYIETIVKLIQTEYEKENFISPSNNASNAAHKILPECKDYPDDELLTENVLKCLIKEAISRNVLKTEVYITKNRNSAKRLFVPNISKLSVPS